MTKGQRYKETKGHHDKQSYFIGENTSKKSSHVEDMDIVERAKEHTMSEASDISEVSKSSCDNCDADSYSSSDSFSFVSPNNSRLKELTSSSDSSSSNYSIEYLERQAFSCTPENSDDSETEFEWFTKQEYEEYQLKNMSLDESSCVDSSGSESSHNSSHFSVNEVEWVELAQLDSLLDYIPL